MRKRNVPGKSNGNERKQKNDNGSQTTMQWLRKRQPT